MLRDWFAGLLNLKPNRKPPTSQICWIEAAENPWGVPILDVRPLTLTTTSTSKDPTCAANAASFRVDNGTGFVDVEPAIDREVAADLRFRIQNPLVDGVLFVPRVMEEKWALFYHQERIICVRSWTRQVRAVAEVEPRHDYVRVKEIRGALTAEDEEPEMTVRVLEYLLISHALDIVFPAPLPPEWGTQGPAPSECDAGTAAVACMSLFGRRAHFAAAEPVERSWLEQPLRTDSLLHIAAARGDLEAVDSLLSSGVPIDLESRRGLTSLHWAAAVGGREVMGYLLERGAAVDARSDEGSTSMMAAAKAGEAAATAFLLEHGADVDARDGRGYTALHRAAEGEHGEVVQLLLERGAEPGVLAEGRTAAES